MREMVSIYQISFSTHSHGSYSATSHHSFSRSYLLSSLYLSVQHNQKHATSGYFIIIGSCHQNFFQHHKHELCTSHTFILFIKILLNFRYIPSVWYTYPIFLFHACYRAFLSEYEPIGRWYVVLSYHRLCFLKLISNQIAL